MLKSFISCQKNTFPAELLVLPRILFDLPPIQVTSHNSYTTLLLSLAMDKYWKEKDSADGTWHFCHKSNDIRTYSKESKVVKKLLNVKPKFPFMT